MYVRESDSHVRCLSCFFLIIDFSIISHSSHFVGTSCEFSIVKSHRYCVNEIAMWNKRFETSVKSMNHSTNRQCVAIALSSQRQLLRHKIFVSWCIVYSILDINTHIDASSHEDAYSERRNSSDVRSHVLQIDSTSYLKSIDHRISIRSFLQSSHRCMIWIELIALKEFARSNTSLKKLQKSLRWKS